MALEANQIVPPGVDLAKLKEREGSSGWQVEYAFIAHGTAQDLEIMKESIEKSDVVVVEAVCI